MEFNQLIAVITGAGSGMGAATAKRLASLGVKVALLDLNLAAAEKGRARNRWDCTSL